MLMPRHQLAETETYRKKIATRKYRHYHDRIVQEIYPRLRENPYTGPSIRRLKGDLHSIHRYRMGDYRPFCTVDSQRRELAGDCLHAPSDWYGNLDR